MAADPEALRRLARLAGLSPSEVRHFVHFEVVRVEDGFEARQLRRLRRARRLRRDLGLSLDAIAIIVRLLDRIEALEAARTPTARARSLEEAQNYRRGER